MGSSNPFFQNILTLNERNIDFIYPYNPRKFFPQVDDKIRTKEILRKKGIPCPETLSIVEHLFHLEEKLDALESQKEIVIKPSQGRAGGGILVLEKKSPNKWVTPSGKRMERAELEAHMGEILFGVFSFGSQDDRVLVEKKLQPHPFFRNIYNQGVADIRIILFMGEPIMAMARIPSAHSEGKANLHQGAMGVGIDLKEGYFTTASYRGKPLESHPDSSIYLPGMKVPHWNTLMDIAQAASNSVNLKYLGVDLVVDETRGPLILELNARPGLEIQVVNQSYLRNKLERYL